MTPSAKRRNGFLLILAILLISSILLIFQTLFRQSGGYVSVIYDNTEMGKYPLEEDREIRLEYGGSYNILVIENSRAYVREAGCPEQICVKHKPIMYRGESIVCLANKIVIKIEAEKNPPADVTLQSEFFFGDADIFSAIRPSNKFAAVPRGGFL